MMSDDVPSSASAGVPSWARGRSDARCSDAPAPARVYARPSTGGRSQRSRQARKTVVERGARVASRRQPLTHGFSAAACSTDPCTMGAAPPPPRTRRFPARTPSSAHNICSGSHPWARSPSAAGVQLGARCFPFLQLTPSRVGTRDSTIPSRRPDPCQASADSFPSAATASSARVDMAPARPSRGKRPR